ncbi:MAG: tRNA (cytosine(32)/uridine(32)-2'-O)-methyltransferase TrmJ [Gammaproteobacteria bacterium CG11_big_fil_rev_8_21_14_0_20_46_22]|nr:MAG: tRNA (cytosine(32)/uridine(32)-2'-O)-methyltransferase TrmJ [Gammaproteobacteria bacterium CG12_big_fil_rev_8_21_14_0_65_46_12]PIR11677.1 MAG: tRNA (cytosine(32)/uridine(32)-2'-O)-methyltransferase TrmJ [Gammaproteobacteria bacterium CG11_big_fil_rev_8_21_14_0_20_46_22]
MSRLDNLSIVLVEPSHPGNIGATARAMKNMGLSNLVLVSPREFPSEEATQRAASAADVLERARCVSTLAEAIADVERVYGCAADLRDQAWPVFSAEALGLEVAGAQVGRRMAIVFGRESTGLNNEELALCHAQVQIPTDSAYNSLNLAQAVQVVCYELHKATLGAVGDAELPALANQAKCAALFQAFAAAAERVAYYDPKRPLNFPTRMRQVILQMNLQDSDADMLLGFLKRL